MYVAGVHIKQAAAPSTHFGTDHPALGVIFYTLQNLTETEAILEIDMWDVTVTYIQYQTINIVTLAATEHSLQMCNQLNTTIYFQKVSTGIITYFFIK